MKLNTWFGGWVDKDMSNVRDTNNFTTKPLQIDVSLTWHNATSAIKKSNLHIRINLTNYYTSLIHYYIINKIKISKTSSFIVTTTRRNPPTAKIKSQNITNKMLQRSKHNKENPQRWDIIVIATSHLSLVAASTLLHCLHATDATPLLPPRRSNPSSYSSSSSHLVCGANGFRFVLLELCMGVLYFWN